MKNIFLIIYLLIPILIKALIINRPGDFPTIQQGINATVDGDTVLVQPGIYYENINYAGKDIVVGSLFLTLQDTTYVPLTIIDGNSSNWRLVSFMSEETEEAKLIGFTIRNGYGYYSSPEDAGGVGIYIMNSSPSIENNIIEDNGCYWYLNGCGIGIQNSSAKIKNNIIRNNDGAYYGGGIYIYQSENVIIENNKIYDHLTESGNGVAYGSGICINQSNDILIKKNLIYDNIVDFGDGGGIALRMSSADIINNTIADNSVYGHGTGIFVNNSSYAEIKNTILWANDPQNNTEIYGNSVTVTYCLTQNGFQGFGNISGNPLFEDTGNGIYNLTLQSPCINAGDPESNLDPDGTIADMGYNYFDMNDYGTVTGTIYLLGGYGNIENVLINCGVETTNPNENGFYFFNILPGNYNITASLTGYETAYFNNIEVFQNQITPNIDMILNFIYTSGIIYVIQDGTGDFTTIQEGIEAAIDGDTVLVCPGTYFENVDFLEKNIVLGSQFLTTQDSSYIDLTIIDGLGTDHTIIVESNTNEYTQICGFTLENSSNDFNCIYCYDASLCINNNILTNHNCTGGSGVNIKFSSMLTIENNRFINNEGKGLIIYNSDDVYIAENLFSGNSIGLSSYDSESSIVCNIFTNNTWGISGYSFGTKIKNNYFSDNLDGISCHGFSPVIENNKFFNNSNGIYCSQWSEPIIINNLIANNNHDGITCLSSSPTIINNTFVNNSDYGIYCINSSFQIADNIIWGNGTSFWVPDNANPTVSYCDIEGEFPVNAIDGGGNIYENPNFAGQDDYHLSENSPCIDVGIPDTTGLNLPEYDLDGNPRISGDRIDMGAYEFQFVNFEEQLVKVNEAKLFPNYPNPFNPETTIRFTAEDTENAEIVIYNIKGQKVKKLLSNSAGQHSVVWDGKDENNNPVSSGVYFYQLNINNKFVASKKCLLLK